MDVSGVNNATNSYPIQPNAEMKTMKDDFSSLEKALNSGNLAGAQSAFAKIQTDGKNVNAPAPDGNSPLKGIQDALQAGDVSGAKKAFDTLKQQMPSVHRGKHHHKAQAAQSGAVSPTTTTSTPSRRSSRNFRTVMWTSWCSPLT